VGIVADLKILRLGTESDAGDGATASGAMASGAMAAGAAAVKISTGGCIVNNEQSLCVVWNAMMVMWIRSALRSQLQCAVQFSAPKMQKPTKTYFAGISEN
jgi:hypothetical protein